MREKYTKRELAADVSAELGITAKQAEDAVQATLVNLVEAVAAGRNVELRGYFVLTPTLAKERVARHPRTGAEVRVRQRRVVKLRWLGPLPEAEVAQ